MAVHDWAQNVAKRLIDKHGREVTLVKSSPTPDNASQPWRGSDAPASGAAAASGLVEVTATAAIVRVTEEDEEFLLVKRGGMAAIVAYTDTSPLTDVSRFTVLRDGSTSWHILNANIVHVGAQFIIYSYEVVQ